MLSYLWTGTLWIIGENALKNLKIILHVPKYQYVTKKNWHLKSIRYDKR